MSSESLSPKPLRRRTLAERMSEDIAERILSGELQPGESLPAGSDLAQQYGVSRAVVRDATNLLAARGLVDVRHGSGVYVTASQRAAFGDALLLTLRRAGATVWDLEQFEELLFPAAAALVSTTASDQELADIRVLAHQYLAERKVSIDAEDGDAGVDDETLPFTRVLQAIFDATHNEVIRQIGAQLTALRRPREWAGVSARSGYEMDRAFLEQLLSILETRDPEAVRVRIQELMKLPAEAIDAMKQTPIGDVARIDLP